MADPSNAALQIHIAACRRGESGYIDPDTGLFVMTSVYLRERDYCCGSGCRHCPYTEAERAAAGRPNFGAWPWLDE